MKRMLAVSRKEFAHILRDPASLTIVFLLPLVMVLLYSYALSFDLTNVRTLIVDDARNELSWDLIRHLASGDVYRCRIVATDSASGTIMAESGIRDGKYHQALIIPRDFDPDASESSRNRLSFILDGSNTNMATRIHQTNSRFLSEFNQGRTPANILAAVTTHIHYNPGLKSADFFVPGLVAILLVMISALLTSLSISREKENGSIDLLFISPLRSWEIIFGKTLPYILVSLVVEALILAAAVLWFEIPFRGSLLVLFPFSLLYVFSGLALGILISTAASNQKTAMFATLLATLLPSIMLSGFIFPLSSLHPILQGLSKLVPATYFLQIIRGVALKGASVGHFLWQGLAMFLFALVLLVLAVLIFTRKREIQS